jgi:beta-lactamase class A
MTRLGRLCLATLLISVGCSGAAGDPVPQSTTTTTLAIDTTTPPTVTTTSIPPSTTTQPTTTTLATTTTTATTTPTTVPTTAPSPTSPPSTDPLGDLCRPQMFTDEVAATLQAEFPGRRFTAHVYDTRSGCRYSLNPGNRQNTASVFKVMVMAGTLLEAQLDGRQPSDWEMGQMHPMITESADPPVRALWNHFGGSPWFMLQGEIFGLSQTSITADSGTAWGATQTSARDQVDLLRQVLLGDYGPLDASYRQTALELMLSVTPSQTWGVTAGVPSGWAIAQKNGFAGSVINSVGWVDEPGPGHGYVIAILTSENPDWDSGIALTERISRIVAQALIDP